LTTITVVLYFFCNQTSDIEKLATSDMSDMSDMLLVQMNIEHERFPNESMQEHMAQRQAQ